MTDHITYTEAEAHDAFEWLRNIGLVPNVGPLTARNVAILMSELKDAKELFKRHDRVAAGYNRLKLRFNAMQAEEGQREKLKLDEEADANAVAAHRINEALCDVAMTVKQRVHIGELLLSIINSARG
jgi:hypothetical protein